MGPDDINVTPEKDMDILGSMFSHNTADFGDKPAAARPRRSDGRRPRPHGRSPRR